MDRHPVSRLLALALVLLALSLLPAGAILAQDGGEQPTPPPTPVPACVPDSEAGVACVKIVFYPATLKADLFLIDPASAVQIPTPQVQTSTLWVTFTNPTPGQTADVVVKNIHDGGVGEGELYTYPDIAKKVTAPYAAGQTTTVTLYPVKTYIRGKIEAKCDIRSVQEGEDVACAVSIDGVPQTIPMPAPTPGPDGAVPPPLPPSPTLAAGQKATFIVDPGKHDVQFDLVGANAGLWNPLTLTKTVTVSAGAYPQYATATFLKAGRVVAKLAQADAGWVGDFYLDGVLAAAQVGSIDQWVTANASHKIEVKNIALTGSPLIHPYYDGTSTAYTSSGVTSSVTVPMTRVPDSVMKSVVKDGESVPRTTNDYLLWNPVFTTKTREQAEIAATMFSLIILLDGVYIGDSTPYREPVEPITNVIMCEGEENVPCYTTGWLIPLGRLPAGQHALYAESTDFFTTFTDGWVTWSPGHYMWWYREFTVADPAAP